MLLQTEVGEFIARTRVEFANHFQFISNLKLDRRVEPRIFGKIILAKRMTGKRFEKIGPSK